MKAVRVLQHGGPEQLQLADVAVPQPGAGQVLIRQTAIGVNFIDVYKRTGLYPNEPPFTLGEEAAGVVEAVGEGVADVRAGDRVAYAGEFGAYAEYNVVPAARCIPVPDGVDDRTACAVLLQGMTAHYLVTDTFALGEGDIALVHAAAGGVGQILVQLAKQRGATVIATAGSADKVALARAAGADHVVDYTQEDFAAATRAIVGEHAVDVAYDAVGRTTWERSLSVLRPRGMLVVYGNSSGPVPPVDPLALARGGSLFLTRPTLVHYVRTREELLGRAHDLFAHIADGTLHVRVGKTYALADAAQAHRDLEARATTGKLLLVP